MGALFEQPDPRFDIGPRHMHHGWQTLETTGQLAFGAYIENGRLIDLPDPSGNGNQKKHGARAARSLRLRADDHREPGPALHRHRP